MTVLIKGMKMPKNCNECDFCHWSNLHQTGICDRCGDEPVCLDYSTDYKRTRARFCPLIELPEKHGRMIDADAYSDFLTDIIKKDGYENLKIDVLTTVAEVLEAVVSDLTGTGPDGFDNAPTIIEAEGDEE